MQGCTTENGCICGQCEQKESIREQIVASKTMGIQLVEGYHFPDNPILCDGRKNPFYGLNREGRRRVLKELRRQMRRQI